MIARKDIKAFGQRPTRVTDGKQSDMDSPNNRTAALDGGNQTIKAKWGVAIVNTRLSKRSGLEMAKEIRKRDPNQMVVIITTTPIEHLPRKQLKTSQHQHGRHPLDAIQIVKTGVQNQRAAMNRLFIFLQGVA
jgi:DNA-binding LytR/AlgR family response regulator